MLPAETTAFDVEFSPVGPGTYSCDVVLRGDDDVRVFRVEVCSLTHTCDATKAHVLCQAQVE